MGLKRGVDFRVFLERERDGARDFPDRIGPGSARDLSHAREIQLDTAIRRREGKRYLRYARAARREREGKNAEDVLSVEDLGVLDVREDGRVFADEAALAEKLDKRRMARHYDLHDSQTYLSTVRPMRPRRLPI